VKKIPVKIVALLAEGKFTYFCTADATHTPHVTPMFYVYDVKQNKIFLMSTQSSKKVKNLSSNPFVALTVDVRDPVNPFLNYGVMVQGVTRLLDVKKHGNVLEMFIAKYPKFVKRERLKGKLLRAYRDVLIEVTPKLMVYWRGAHFTRWKAA
jgi:nitroimidazol reductase NimA-like FMN-containing flavoprotein (pyridoxamine 5'-phosphate oxidase superfamily)